MDTTLTECVAKNINCDTNDVLRCADSIMCEPSNEVGLCQNSVIDSYEHLNETPVHTSSYLKECAHLCNSECIIIDDESKLLTCKVYEDNSKHKCNNF